MFLNRDSESLADASILEQRLIPYSDIEYLDKESWKGPRVIDPSGTFSWMENVRLGKNIIAISSEVGIVKHLRGGKWSLRVDFPLSESFGLDTLRYYNTLLFWFPGTRLSSFIGGWLSPGMEIQRPLDRHRRFKLFVGIDIVLGTNLANDSTHHENDWFDGILYSPRVGFEVHPPGWRFRVYVSENIWDRFNRRTAGFDIGPSVGFSVGLGSDYNSDLVPCACNREACE